MNAGVTPNFLNAPAVKGRVTWLVKLLIIAGAGHNDLFRHPKFRAAMREALTALE